MPDCDTPRISERLRLAADLLEGHARSIEIEVQMKIDIEIEAARDFKNAGDLRVRIAVGIGATTDQIGASIARRDEQFVRARIVEQSFLRKHADLQIDCPSVVALE